jgi:hypothetical protein
VTVLQPSRTCVSTSHPALLYGGVLCLHLASPMTPPYVHGSNSSGLPAVAFSALLGSSTLGVLSGSTGVVFGPFLAAHALVLTCPEGRVSIRDRAMQAQGNQGLPGCQGGQVSRPMLTLLICLGLLRASRVTSSIQSGGRWRAIWRSPSPSS